MSHSTIIIRELCQPSKNGRGGPIAPIPIEATDFGLRHHMIQQVQNTCQFHELSSDDANRHIDKFLEITQHIKQNGVSDDALHLSLFPYSLTHHAIACYTNDTFYNGLTLSHRDTINAAAGGTFMQKTPEECYELIENMTAHHNHWDTSATRDETSRNISSTTSTESPEVVRQLELMNKNFLNMMKQMQTVKSVDTKCETCGGPHSFTECPAVDGYTQEAAYATTEGIDKNEFKTSMSNQNNEIKKMLSNFFQMQNPSGSGSLPSNTVANPRGDVKAITTRSGVAYDGPSIPPTLSPLPKEVERETEATKDKVQNTSLESTTHVQPPVVQDPILELEVAPKPNPKPSIPYPLRLNDQKLREKANQMLSSFIPELTSTRMTLELANRSTVIPNGVAEDVFVKVGKFYFPADFVVVDYDCTLRDNARNYYDEMVHQVDVSCEEYAQEVLGFLDSSTSGNPTPSDPIIASSSPSFTPFEGGNFVLEEIEACLSNDSIPPGIDDADFDPEGDIRLLERLLNEDPSPNLPPMKNDDLTIDVTMTKAFN
ncbi:hypothetical protein Tco_1437370 [Tanacetum coccineum]